MPSVANVERIAGADPATSVVETVLVVDDSRSQRRAVGAMLRRLGYGVLEAGDGFGALEMIRAHAIDLVITDWMMPGLTGPQLCRAIRALSDDRYLYTILLTARHEATDVAVGLNSGADDFLVKPVSSAELQAKIGAADRMLALQRALSDRNRELGVALGELRGLYESLERDLRQARALQEALVPKSALRFGPAEVHFALRSSGHVGGDLVGAFQVDPTHVGLYSLDVSGHGISSALMTARLAGLFSGAVPDQNIAVARAADGHPVLRPPEEVAERLNDLLLEDWHTDHYLTLCLCGLDLGTGELHLVQAGHPHPLLHRARGRIDRLGKGGLPIGLLPGAHYDGVCARLGAGDRLLLTSDGVTEAMSPEGRLFDARGVRSVLRGAHALSGTATLQALNAAIDAHSGSDEPSDDVSALLLDLAAPEIRGSEREPLRSAAEDGPVPGAAKQAHRVGQAGPDR